MKLSQIWQEISNITVSVILDVLTKAQRQKNMRAIKSKGSRIEKILGKAMWGRGIRYRKHSKKVFGKPDFTIKKYMIAIFCDSEFFHGKDWETAKKKIKSNRKFWYSKIESNIKRDLLVNQKLQKEGWIVIRFWGDDIKQRTNYCVSVVESTIGRRIAENEKQNT
ncbi:MAG: very short patch repair endonuclease [Calditrichia bacterium]